MVQRRIEWAAAFALLFLTIALYARTSRYDFVNYDDPDYTSNAHVRGGLTAENVEWAFTSSYAANWFPLTWISHLTDREVFADGSGGPHAVNFLLHAIATLLLFTLLNRMTHALWPSFFVAFVFAVHPLHVESVAWISERKDVLNGVFWMLALWAYLKFTERKTWTWYAVLVAAFVAGLMSKATIVTLPFVLLLLDWWPLRRTSRARLGQIVTEKLPLIGISVIASIVTYLVQQRGGAVSTIDQIPLSLRISNALVSYVRYIADFFWPAKLAVFYPYRSISLLEAAAAGFALIAIAILALRRDYLAVGWLWFLGTLVPMIGLVQIGLQSRADRYTYIPLIGLAIMVGWGAAELFANHRPVAIALGAVVCVAWFAVAWIDVGYWRDSSSLFEHAIQVTDGNYVAYNNLGAAERRMNRLNEAMVNFEHALRIKPHYADAENNLGEALLAEGRAQEAIPHIMAALRFDSNLPEAHVNLGAALSRAGRYRDAEIEYRSALGLAPDSADAHGGLGVALTEQGEIDQAIPELAESVSIKPDDADGHYNLGRAFGLAGRIADAIPQFQETIRLQPANAEAHFNLGTALASKERMNEAVAQFAEAARLKPDYVAAHFNAGSALASLGRFDEAIREFSETLRLEPDFEQAKESLEYCRQLKREK